jgi:hypothetical protein
LEQFDAVVLSRSCCPVALLPWAVQPLSFSQVVLAVTFLFSLSDPQHLS